MVAMVGIHIRSSRLHREPQLCRKHKNTTDHETGREILQHSMTQGSLSSTFWMYHLVRYILTQKVVMHGACTRAWYCPSVNGPHWPHITPRHIFAVNKTTPRPPLVLNVVVLWVALTGACVYWFKQKLVRY